MLHTMKRGLFVGAVVALAAALCSTSALAARGHGTFGPRAAHGGPHYAAPAYGHYKHAHHGKGRNHGHGHEHYRHGGRGWR